MKALISWMTAGRVRIGGVQVTTLSRTANVRISNGSSGVPAGELEPASSTGSHVTEFQLYVDGESYVVVYYNSAAENNYAVAYYNSSMELIGGILGGNPVDKQKIKTATVVPPNNTRYVRVFCLNRAGSNTYNKEASFTPVNAGGLYMVEQMRVRAAGDAVNQVVWPTETTYRIVANTARVVFNRNTSHFFASGTNYITGARADIQVTQGEVVQTLTNQPLTIVRIKKNYSLVIDGVEKNVYSMDANNRIHAENLKTTRAYHTFGGSTWGTFGSLIARYQDQEIEIEFEQEPNVVDDTSYGTKNYNGYRIELSETDFEPGGGSATVSGYKQFTAPLIYTWTSGSTSQGDNVTDEEPQSPGSITVTKSPSSAPDARVSGNTVYFPENTRDDENVYTVTGSWSRWSGSVPVYVYGSDTGRTYENARVVWFYYPNKYGLGEGYIPAGGGDMYPEVRVAITCNGSNMIGSVNDGSTSCQVTGGGMTATVTIEYDGAVNGLVSAPNLTTNETSSNTVIATVRMRVVKGTERSSWSSATVRQERNQKWIASGDEGNFNVSSFSVTPKIGGTALPYENGNYKINTANQTAVFLDFRVTGSGRTDRYTYTALDSNGNHYHSGGNTSTKTNEAVPRSDLSNLSVRDGNNNSITVSDLEFTADNRHLLADRTYNISANYGNTGASASASVLQVKDNKIPVEENRTVTIAAGTSSIWAGGGTADFVVTAYSTSGSIWESDGTVADSSSAQTDNTSSILLNPIASSAVAYPLIELISTNTTNHTRTYRVTHRDMMTNETTDMLSITASNGSSQTPNPITYSVLNQKEPANWFREFGGTDWNPYEPRARSYDLTFDIDRYDSDDDRAPSRSASTISTAYSVLARHSMYNYRTGVEHSNKYIPYTSWSQEHNDDNHRYLDSVDDMNVWEWGSFIEWVTDTPSLSRPNTDTWLTINAASDTGGTLVFATNTNAVRRVSTVTAVHTADPNRQSIELLVYQEAYQDLTASPTSHMFPWQNPASVYITISSSRVSFMLQANTQDATWFNAYISLDGGTETLINEETVYSCTTAQLKVSATTNFDAFRKFGTIIIKPQSIQDVLGNISITLGQEAYDPGPSNE